ncbi:MAG: endopeptidase La [Bacteroidales bacterium]|nr:endopeptidase La [Bacteroidales bacterium]
MKIPKFSLNQMESGEINIIPVIDINGSANMEEVDMPNTLPILALRDAVLFPGTILPITVGREKSLKLVKALHKSSNIIGTVTQKDPSVEEPVKDDLFHIGTSARIIRLIEMPDGALTAILQGIKRFSLDTIISEEPYLIGTITYREDILSEDQKVVEPLMSSIKDAAMAVIRMTPHMPQETLGAIKGIGDVKFLVNMVATNLDNDLTPDKLDILSADDIVTRGYKLLASLNKHVEILKIKEDIQQKVKQEMDQQQREYYLNNQLKTIQEELGMDGNGKDVAELRQRAKSKDWPEWVAKNFEKELARLERSNPNSPEYGVQLNYVEFILDLPWNYMTKDNLDMKHAMKVLDKDHFGLETVKERIIEYLAVLKLKGDMKSPILCLYGPPGVGKTSLGKSIAKALGRKYGRISLGGLHDESEIRGHRKTYIGAMAGRIIQTISKTGSSNPVIVLDEIDKVSADYKGDPASALLEVLDPEQNTTFHDNYLDMDYDLSKVLFITTANNVSTIHRALRDRMEMIPVNGYLAEEKYHIAKDYLIPKQREAHGLDANQLKINKGGIETIIDKYTRESGVRTLDKQIAKIARNMAKRIALEEEIPAHLDSKAVTEILGLPTNNHDMQKGNEGTGVVTGLAWTEMGGEILFVETSLSEGKGVLTTTGSLGDVMKESAMIAYQYIKAHPHLLGLKAEDIQNKDVHIHVPEGAIPKDGPSAGITMVSSMASAFMGKSVKPAIAMTGEMTLRGKVLPVGGIKEKILAAKRAGINTIILSAENEKDIKDIKEVYIKGLEFHYVKTMEDVLKFIF